LAKHDIGNPAAANLGEIIRVMTRRPKQIQYRPHAVDGCPADTGRACGTDQPESHCQQPHRHPTDQRATGSDQIAALV
jgi:hypothetical protein